MNKATELLKKSGVFYIATMDGDQPRVRPFGAVAEIDGKIYICTNNQKEVFRQIEANPKVELSGMTGENSWIRITGTLKSDNNIKAKQEFLTRCPLPFYKAEDEIFEVLYFETGTVTTASFTSEPETFDLY